MTVHCHPHFSLSNTPFLTSKSIHFCIISSPIFKKNVGFSLSHFIFHVLSVLFLILWVCCCHYALKNVMFVPGFTLSWWVFFDWELVFFTVNWLYYCCLYEVYALCSVSWMCCFIHIMFLVFCHIICHLNPCDAQCLLDSKLLLFIIIFDCLFHLLC